MGPPCETWSSARHEQLYNAEGEPITGPRPLRSAQRPWGLDGLRPKEYRQLQVGMRLLLRGLVLTVYTILSGGATLLEHPAEPKPDDRASIWRTAIVNLLIEIGLLKKYTFAQWKFGGVGIKPTTLLHGNLDNLPTTMRRHELQDAVKPTVALGRTDTGEFRTGRAKEYPPQMNAAIASSVATRWLADVQRALIEFPEWQPSESLGFTDFLNSLSKVCATIQADQSWLPDYQGR